MSDIAKKSVETFVVRTFIQAFALGGAIVIARTLGPSGKGLYAYAVTTVMTVQMIYAGQGAAISWQTAKRKRAPAEIYRLMMRILACTALPVSAAAAAIGYFVPHQEALLAVAAAIPFAMFVQVSTGFFLADSNVRTVNIQQVLMSALVVAIYAPLLIWAHMGLRGLFAVWVFAYLVAAIYTWFSLRQYRENHEGTPGDRVLREQVLYGAQVGVNSLVQFLNFRIDVYLVLFILGQSALGIYTIGIGAGELLWQISRPIANAAYGRIARGEMEDAANTTATCLRHTLALVTLAGLVAFIAAPYVVRFVYGARFAASAEVVRVLLPGIIAYSAMPTFNMFFSQQLGQPRIPLVFSSTSLVVCAVLTILLIPRFGILGGAIATSVSYTAAFALAAAYFVHRTQIAPRRLFALSRGDLRPYRDLAVSVLRR